MPESFSLNQLNFSPKISLQDLYFIVENQPVYASMQVCVACESQSRRKAGPDADQS
jgi:hypothetical protein